MQEVQQQPAKVFQENGPRQTKRLASLSRTQEQKACDVHIKSLHVYPRHGILIHVLGARPICIQEDAALRASKTGRPITKTASMIIARTPVASSEKLIETAFQESTLPIRPCPATEDRTFRIETLPVAVDIGISSHLHWHACELGLNKIHACPSYADVHVAVRKAGDQNFGARHGSRLLLRKVLCVSPLSAVGLCYVHLLHDSLGRGAEYHRISRNQHNTSCGNSCGDATAQESLRKAGLAVSCIAPRSGSAMRGVRSASRSVGPGEAPGQACSLN